MAGYLIVNPEEESLNALKLNAAGEYEAVTHRETLHIDLCETCHLTVSVNQLFR
ncbi:MAG: hypothetical protein GY903_18725 [Fuerstiella sp.]|nr:hypothetical protein [Fuerstiella sp.]MCP4856520.1 hypothetical protein [Fuerstiella sp.]